MTNPKKRLERASHVIGGAEAIYKTDSEQARKVTNKAWRKTKQAEEIPDSIVSLSKALWKSADNFDVSLKNERRVDLAEDLCEHLALFPREWYIIEQKLKSYSIAFQNDETIERIRQR